MADPTPSTVPVNQTAVQAVAVAAKADVKAAVAAAPGFFARIRAFFAKL